MPINILTKNQNQLVFGDAVITLLTKGQKEMNPEFEM